MTRTGRKYLASSASFTIDGVACDFDTIEIKPAPGYEAALSTAHRALSVDPTYLRRAARHAARFRSNKE